MARQGKDESIRSNALTIRDTRELERDFSAVCRSGGWEFERTLVDSELSGLVISDISFLQVD